MRRVRTNDVFCSIDDGGGGDGDVDPAAVAAMSAVEDVVGAVNSQSGIDVGKVEAFDCLGNNRVHMIT